MNTTNSKTILQSMRAPFEHDKGNVGLPSKKIMEDKKVTTNRFGSIKERKKALQQDVYKLKIKLRHEENVHRALERAFTRPLGALPRLPPYLPPHTLELLAEVAVLEEEVVWLEDQVVHFRQGLYEEAVYISSSQRNIDSSCEPLDLSPINIRGQKQTKLAPNEEENLIQSSRRLSPMIYDTVVGKENDRCSNPSNDKHQMTVGTPSKKYKSSVDKYLYTRKLQVDINQECKIRTPVKGGDSPNVISETILKCLLKFFIRTSSKRSKTVADPYGICLEFGDQDIGPYKNLFSVEATSINPNQTKVSVFLIRRLRLFLEKLAYVDLTGLNHQEKLAFWINNYNSCMMIAYLEHGVPENPELVVALMHKATINVGGHVVNAITIEHFILRLPYHSKFTFTKSLKYEETSARSIFGLELSEPLVTFALSCGSWSSPAVRIYTAKGVEKELGVAKKEYLQASIGISTRKKFLVIPKLIDWYKLDFAKDLESFVDWICLELPNELGKEAIRCLERRKDEPLSHEFLEIMPYDFNFRYLLYT